jgi:hypothetical protein
VLQGSSKSNVIWKIGFFNVIIIALILANHPKGVRESKNAYNEYHKKPRNVFEDQNDDVDQRSYLVYELKKVR